MTRTLSSDEVWPRIESVLPGKEGDPGRSRAGLTTKPHLAVDDAGRPLRTIVTEGQVSNILCANEPVSICVPARSSPTRVRLEYLREHYPRYACSDRTQLSDLEHALRRASPALQKEAIKCGGNGADVFFYSYRFDEP